MVGEAGGCSEELKLGFLGHVFFKIHGLYDLPCFVALSDVASEFRHPPDRKSVV